MAGRGGGHQKGPSASQSAQRRRNRILAAYGACCQRAREGSLCGFSRPARHEIRVRAAAGRPLPRKAGAHAPLTTLSGRRAVGDGCVRQGAASSLSSRLLRAPDEQARAGSHARGRAVHARRAGAGRRCSAHRSPSSSPPAITRTPSAQRDSAAKRTILARRGALAAVPPSPADGVSRRAA